MDDSQSKFSRLHEEVLGRYQQGGYLNGDYVKINKKALNDDRFSDPMKARIKELISDKKYLRISAIKSSHSDAFKGPVGAAGVPGETWADCYVEQGPGMWTTPITLPLDVLDIIEVADGQGFPPYDKAIVRGNRDDGMVKPSDEIDKQTKGKDPSRQLPTKNIKIKESTETVDSDLFQVLAEVYTNMKRD